MSQVPKKLPTSYGIRSFITLLTTAPPVIYPVKGVSFSIFRNRCDAVFPSTPQQIRTGPVRVTTYSSHSGLNRAGRPLVELWALIWKVFGANLQPSNLLCQMKCCLIFLRSSSICWDSASIRLR
jgi:hypothetical protein